MFANQQGDRAIIGGLIAATLAVALGGGCNRIVKDTGDLTLPGIALEVRGPDGRFRPATEASLGRALAAGHALELQCAVTDPGGVSKVTLAFGGTAEACLVGGAPSAPDADLHLTGLPAPRTLGLPDDGSAAAS